MGTRKKEIPASFRHTWPLPAVYASIPSRSHLLKPDKLSPQLPCLKKLELHVIIKGFIILI